MEEKKGLDFNTADYSADGRALRIIDQTLLPGKMKFLELRSKEDIREAIYMLRVRGAPAIGVAAAIGLQVTVQDAEALSEEAFMELLMEHAAYLAAARPTAVNLKWALNRMTAWAEAHRGQGTAALICGLKQEAERIRDEDIRVCRKLGEYGLTVLKPGQGILTHCNAGHLATIRYGTATAPMYLGHERGYGFHIYADETRPLLQGARLTSFELAQAGMDVTLICDNMASSVMKKGLVQTVITGCDRVAANGDAANKIGTSGVAILAKHYGVEFYIAAPTSTIDFDTPDGDAIVIEERDGEEIRSMWYQEPMAPEGVCRYNPAFDVTDHGLITGIITEYGIARPPYRESLAAIRKQMLSDRQRQKEKHTTEETGDNHE
ncbi:MAG: S-methyl-5-thioribose-1-phosphate isomerase [Anaerovoracaceae bacterium]